MSSSRVSNTAGPGPPDYGVVAQFEIGKRAFRATSPVSQIQIEPFPANGYSLTPLPRRTRVKTPHARPQS
jgi:hypothetical protein